METDPKLLPRSEAAVKNDLPPANARSQLTAGRAMAAGHSQLCASPGRAPPTFVSAFESSRTLRYFYYCF